MALPTQTDAPRSVPVPWLERALPFTAVLGVGALMYPGPLIADRLGIPEPGRFLSLFAGPLLYAAGWQVYRVLLGPPPEVKRRALPIFFLNFFVADLLGIFNPFALWTAVAQGLAMAAVRGPVTADDCVRLHLPFRGRWFVYKGGMDKADSHSRSVAAQRYAYDFVIGSSRHETSLLGNGRLTDYPAYGQDILAPADGTVAEVRRTSRDAAMPGSGWLDYLTVDLRGNYVLIECAPDVYVLLAHLRAGSVAVEVGQSVRAGTKIGECGNSGRSTEPHLHLHCQRGKSFAFGVGLPIRFLDCAGTDGGRAGEGVALRGGMQATSVPAAVREIPLER